MASATVKICTTLRRGIHDLSIGTIDAVRERMRRAAIVLLLVTACIRPSQTRSHGYLGGGLLVAVGAGLIGLPLLGHCDRCERDDGLFNSSDAGQFFGITLGAIIAAGGLAKLAVQLAAPTATPAPVPPPAPPVPAARPDDGQPRPEPSEDGSAPAIGLLP